MSRIILQLEPSEPKLWVVSQAPSPKSNSSWEFLSETLDRDGVGLGVGATAILILGMLLGTGVWALVQLVKNTDPVKIGLQISNHIEKTQARLDTIDQTTLGNDRKIELLMSIAHRNEAMLREARQAGLDMSGELHKIQKTIDVAIREVSKN